MVTVIENNSLPILFKDIIMLQPSKYRSISDNEDIEITKYSLKSKAFNQILEINEDEFNKKTIQFDGDQSKIDVLFGAKLTYDYYKAIIDLFGTSTIFLYNVREDLLLLGDLLREIYHSGTIPSDDSPKLKKLYSAMAKTNSFLSYCEIFSGTNSTVMELDVNVDEFEEFCNNYLNRLVNTISIVYAYNSIESFSGRNPIANPKEATQLLLDLIEKENDKYPNAKPTKFKYMDHRNNMFDQVDYFFDLLDIYDEKNDKYPSISNQKYFVYKILERYE